jgi:hypothetical protein
MNMLLVMNMLHRMHVFTLYLYEHDFVYGCYVVYGCDEYYDV